MAAGTYLGTGAVVAVRLPSEGCAWCATGDLAGWQTGLYDDKAKGLDWPKKTASHPAMNGKILSLDDAPDSPSGAVLGGRKTVPTRLAGDDDRKRGGERGNPSTAVITKTKPQTKRPNLYRVLLLNDDYTPMEFVVHVLERFFNKDREAATRIMLHVHHHGIGECGIYTYEVAETKVTQVMDFARKHQHPLQCVMEKK